MWIFVFCHTYDHKMKNIGLAKRFNQFFFIISYRKKQTSFWLTQHKHRELIKLLFLTFFPFRVELLWLFFFQFILTIIFPTLVSSVLNRRFKNVTFLERIPYFSLWNYLLTYWHIPMQVFMHILPGSVYRRL